MTAVQALRDLARVRAGQRLLIRGAAGGVGSAAIQVGRALGATTTGLRRGDQVPAGERFDVVFDTVGQGPWSALEGALEPAGTFVTTGFSPSLAVKSAIGWIWSRRRHRLVVSRADGELMREVSRLAGLGQLNPAIDSTWPLERIREAYQRLEAGHPQGKVVISLPA
jgi:NADPH:quinone reductase-like Zn-dependent oxidoreductase